MALPPGEWLKQAKYDLAAARDMFKAGRHVYVVFMCHLSIEKALKGAYAAKLGKAPPRTHSLITLVKATGLAPPHEIARFLVGLNQASVPTRYPEDLTAIRRAYRRTRAARMLEQARETLSWIRSQC